MRLFPRTLLSFVGVIAFQSTLTFLLVTSLSRRADLAEARRDLEGEAAILLDAFNSWKRQLWISLIRIGKDQRLGQHLGRPGLAAGELDGYLRELLFESKADSLLLREPGSLSPRIYTVGNATFELSDLRYLRNRKEHPYLEFLFLGQTLSLVGVTTLPGGEGEDRADLYVVKRIDAELCNQLTRGRKSRVAVYLGERYLVGSSSVFPPPVFDPGALTSAYHTTYNARVDGGRYNIAFEWAGQIEGLEEAPRPTPVYVARPGDLFLGVSMSNAPYAERILLLSRVVLLVSLAGAGLTIGLCLFLTRNITHPVAELLAAMERIAGGAYETRVGHRGGSEIGRLFIGLNEMAEELHQRREAMQEHIRETTLLKEYNERIIDSIRAGIAIVDGDLVVEKANDTFRACFRLGANAVGARLDELPIDVVDGPLLAMVGAIVRGEREQHAEIKRGPDERVFEIKLYPFYAHGMPSRRGCVLVVEDVTVKTELEQKIYQAEKLSTVSMLSAGMAHEINNPIGSILSNAQNLIEEEVCEERRASLRWIETEARRIARIVQELLKFAAPDTGQAPGSAVNAVIADVVRLVESTLGRENRIRIDTRLAEDAGSTALSPDELTQVTINLIANSIQAIPGAGRITVTTRLRPRKGAVCMTVADTGQGIPKNVLPRVFDPFFTTKANGQGTGLGLSVVWGIVTKHGGHVAVSSREGHGTRIVLDLPHLGDS